MGISFPEDRDLWFIPTDHTCFKCGDAIANGDAAAFWAGCAALHAQAAIMLHAACAKDLGMKLIADGHEAGLANGGGRHAEGHRARRLVQHITSGRIPEFEQVRRYQDGDLTREEAERDGWI